MMKTGLRHFNILAMVGAGYLLNHLISPAFGGFWSNHAANILAGISLPAIAALLSDSQTPAGMFVRRPMTRIGIVVAAAFVWEVLAPMLMSNSIGDLIDAIAYLTGTLAYIAASAAYHHRRATRALETP